MPWICLVLMCLCLGCGTKDDPKPSALGPTGGAGGDNNPGPPETTEGMWVEELLLGVTVGSDMSIVHRWDEAVVNIQVIDNSTAGFDQTALDGAIAAVNVAMDPTGTSVATTTADAAARLYIGDQAALLDAKLAEQVPDGFDGSVWAFWAANGTLTTAILLVDEAADQTFFAATIARAVGVLNSSDHFSDSIFALPPAGPDLASRDAMLLEFLYTQLRAGDKRVDLRVAFNAWWPQ